MTRSFAFEGEPVVLHSHCGHRGVWNARVDLVPDERPGSDVPVHLLDRALGSYDACPEPLCQQVSVEPVVAVAVGDEDVGQVAVLARDPAAQRRAWSVVKPGSTSTASSAPEIRVLARCGKSPRFLVREVAVVLLRRLVDKYLVGEAVA